MSPAKPTPAAMKQRLVSVTLDEESIGRSNPDVEHERTIAIYDLLEMNHFAPVGDTSGPYALHLSINDSRTSFVACVHSDTDPDTGLLVRLKGYEVIWKFNRYLHGLLLLECQAANGSGA